MASNRGVVYEGPGKVEIHTIDFDQGAAKKFVIDPHGIVGKKAA